MTATLYRCMTPCLLCWLWCSVEVIAQTQPASDPTHISPQLKELLGGLTAGTADVPPAPAIASEEPEVAPVIPHIRLQGLLIRDASSGVAILRCDDERVVVALDRARLPELRITIAGLVYSVVDFHTRGLELRSVRTGETIYLY